MWSVRSDSCLFLYFSLLLYVLSIIHGAQCNHVYIFCNQEAEILGGQWPIKKAKIGFFSRSISLYFAELLSVVLLTRWIILSFVFVFPSLVRKDVFFLFFLERNIVQKYVFL